MSIRLVNFPILLFVISFVVLRLSVQFGVYVRTRVPPLEEDERKDFDLVLASTLTLLSLIIGFSFSMAITRYDHRKNLEAEEANVIGTEYARADLLPPADAARVHELLKDYLKQRVLFYESGDVHQLDRIGAETSRLKDELWSAVKVPAMAKPTPVIALVVSGMNNVLDSEGYTQAAWWNRIPRGSWVLMGGLAFFCNVLIGYSAHCRRAVMLLILPFVIALAFFLIADIDSPHRGVIHVIPKNLVTLSSSLNARQ
ncbi:MAG: hypothetical protein CXZ00_04355 [Acidobacteria bacterium]|nr:MAG: hypothetical protein CXZ00_04355 [Acidobacteriota bacterium]